MKLFGNNPGRNHTPEEELPAPKDKTRKRRWEDDTPEVDEGYVDDEYDDEYEDEYDDDEYDEYDDDEYDDDEYDDDEYDDDEYDDDDYDDDDEGGMSLGKKIAIGVAALLLILVVAAGLFVNYLLDLINYQSADSEYFATVSVVEELPEEDADYENSHLEELKEQEEAESLEATPEELAQWDKELEDITSDSATFEVPISEDVYNILLIGSDTRVSGEVGRSDAMILVSINQKSKKIYLTSFLRDCYVAIPGYGNTRLNHAFAYGGPDLLEKTLETNFKVHVDKYVAVDFFSFMDVVDTLGGIWLNVTDEERKVTNDYVWSMNKLMGEEDPVADYLWSSGWQLLNGKQTLCYARNRYTGNDYERTQRQRTVISQILSGCMSSSPATLVDLAQVILPQVTTDMEKTQILNYAANVVAYLDYEIVQQQIPASGTYSGATISGMSVISLNLEQNIQYLQSTIYEGVEY